MDVIPNKGFLAIANVSDIHFQKYLYWKGGNPISEIDIICSLNNMFSQDCPVHITEKVLLTGLSGETVKAGIIRGEDFFSKTIANGLLNYEAIENARKEKFVLTGEFVLDGEKKKICILYTPESPTAVYKFIED